jgi:uncharacterized protein
MTTDIITGDNYDNSTGTDRVGNWMQTYAGRKFWPIDPRPEEVHIEDIAHALANSCRFAGHCLKFYSVAEHSVLLSTIVPPEMALVGLLHDATEAYVVDVPRPLKPFLAEFKDIEHKVWCAIAQRYGLDYELPDRIKHADNEMVLAERVQIMTPTDDDWCVPAEPANVVIEGWLPHEAKYKFLERFAELAA